jgi:hypothetical protein
MLEDSHADAVSQVPESVKTVIHETDTIQGKSGCRHTRPPVIPNS